MDSRLLDTCRYTGIKRTALNKNEFVKCSECGGYTHKTLGFVSQTSYDLTKDNKVHAETKVVPAQDLLQREGYRCSHCGSTLEIEET